MGFIEDQVVELMRELPPERKHEVLHFVRELHKKYVPAKPRKSVEGLWADLNIHLTEEDIDEMRRELWGVSPKKDT